MPAKSKTRKGKSAATTSKKGAAPATKRGPGRPRKVEEVAKPPAKRGRPVGSKNRPKNNSAPTKKSAPKGNGSKSTASKKSTAAKSTKSQVETVSRDFDEVTGFVIGTDQHLIAQELMEGGETRAKIIERIRDEEIVEPETRSGNEKAIPNVVANVVTKMLDRGFTVEASWRLVPPSGSKVKGKRGRK